MKTTGKYAGKGKKALNFKSEDLPVWRHADHAELVEQEVSVKPGKLLPAVSRSEVFLIY